MSFVVGRKRFFAKALDVQHAEQRFAVGNRDAENRARLRQNAPKVAGSIVYTLRCAGAGDTSKNAGAERETLAAGFNACACLRLDLDVFGRVIENADADVIEAESSSAISTHNRFEHLLGISLEIAVFEILFRKER